MHDPSFAASWISSFEKGPSPSWFLALPTSARAYLHTYADGGNLVAVATAAAGIQSVESVVSSQLSVACSWKATSSTGGGGVGGGGGNGTTAGGSGSSSSGSVVGGTGASSSSSTSDSTTSASASSLSSSLSSAGAARETGVFAAGAVAMAGILGLAVAL